MSFAFRLFEQIQIPGRRLANLKRRASWKVGGREATSLAFSRMRRTVDATHELVISGWKANHTHKGQKMIFNFAIVTLGITSACLLAGCTSIEVLDDFKQPHLESVEVAPEPPAETVQPPAEYVQSPIENGYPLTVGKWRCSWDATTNHDWHDDYVCTNGVDFERPNLIPGDTFVERWEIDEAAAAHERTLNS